VGEIKEISSAAYPREKRRRERERSKSAFLGGVKVTKNLISLLTGGLQRAPMHR